MFDIVCPKRPFLALLEHCHPVADRKSAVPMLANVLLDAAGRHVRASATDLYLGMSGECEAEVATGGRIALPAKDLFERVKVMPEGPVQITSADGAMASVKAVGAARRYTLHGLPGGDFPELPSPEGDSLTIPVDTLSRLMARTHFSISPDETRAHVNSALLEWSGDVLRMVTTDGHRLSKQEAKAERSGSLSLLIQAKAIGGLRHLMDHAKSEKAAEVAISQKGPTAFFDVAGLRFSCKTPDAQFPPWQQVVPRSSGSTVLVPRTLLAGAVKAVQLAANDRTGGVTLLLEKGALRIEAESADTGKGEDSLPVDYDGPAFKLGMNAKYILDVLGALDTDDVHVEFIGELDPLLIREGDFLGVLMPMRT